MEKGSEMKQKTNHSHMRFGLVPLLCLLMLPPQAADFAECGGRKQRLVYVGMILGAGGLGDRSFNDSAYEGLRDAQRQYGIRFELANHLTPNKNRAAIAGFAREKFDLIIGIGYENREIIEETAAAFPDIHFAAIDVVARGDNVASVIFREPEGDFLMGVLAAMLTRTRTVGVIGGMDIPVIRRIESGFRQGVDFKNDRVRVLFQTAGAFNDPARGRRLALEMYNRGADVIYNAAGRTGLGIIEAAKETDKLTLGTSGDQRYLAPDHVVGNRPKRVDRAVLTLIAEIKAGRFIPGIRSFGFKEGGLQLGPFNPALVTPSMRAELDRLKQKIIQGEIKVYSGE